MTQLRILLVDNHALLRTGLKQLINAQTDMVVVGEASNGAEAIRQLPACQADGVVMDVSMPEMNGAAATAQIKQAWPQVWVLALTRHSDHGYVQRLLQAGASGYVLKKTTADALIQAIRRVAAGDTYLDPSLTGALEERLVRPTAATDADHLREPLTPREAEVLRLIAWGQSNREIAALLDLSVKTVESHKANAAAKLGLRSRTAILRYALSQGWLPDEPGLT